MRKLLLDSIILVCITAAQAQTQVGKYAFNGDVKAIVADAAGSTYLGGEFTTVGIYYGSGVRLNSSGILDTAFSKVAGVIYSVVAIPSGGWYIGGDFTQIDSAGINVARNRLARINSDGSLHAFNPNMNSSVYALAKDASGNLYAGGGFTSVGGTTRNYLAKFDSTGILNNSFNPNMNDAVNALAVDASGNLYAGGVFTTVGGTTRNRLAKFGNTGILNTSFNPNMDNSVNALAVDASGNLYAGGNFTTVGGGSTTRNYLAKFNTAGTLNTSFNPDMDNIVLALATDATGNLYAGGYFTAVNFISRNRLAKFDNSGSLNTSFDPNMNNFVSALAVDASGNLYAGGFFTTVGGTTTRNRLAKFSNSGTLTSFDPNMNSGVLALAIEASGNLYAGGFFTTVGGSTTRNYLAKLDNTGNLTSFDPNMSSYVRALATDASGNLYAGGFFTTVGGTTTRNRLAKFDNTGTLSTTFNPNMNGEVSALAVDASGNLYAGGFFTTVGGGSTTRNYLAKFGTTGSLNTSFNPNMNNFVSALATDASGNLYAGGAFATVGGTSRNRLAKFDSTGTLNTGFNPNMSGSVSALATDASGNLYAGGSFTSVGGGSTTRNRLAKFDNTGTLTSFDPDMNNNYVLALATDASGNLYAGGDFTTVGGTTRNRLAKFDNTGTLTSFNPNMNGNVWTLATDASGKIHVGGVFTRNYAVYQTIPFTLFGLMPSALNGVKFSRKDKSAGFIFYGDASNYYFAIDTSGITSGALTGDTVTIQVNTTIDSFKSSSGTNQEHAMFLLPRYWDAKGSFTGTVKIRFPYQPSDTLALMTLRDSAWARLKRSNTNTLAVKTSKLEWFKTVGVPYNAAYIASIVGNTFPTTIVKPSVTYGVTTGQHAL